MMRDYFSYYLLPLGVAGHQLEVEQVGLWSDRRYQDSPQIHLETWPSHVQQVVYNNLQSNSKEQSTTGCRLQFTKNKNNFNTIMDFTSVLTRRSTGLTTQTWSLRARVCDVHKHRGFSPWATWQTDKQACAPTSPPASSSPPARSTSLGSPSTTRTATWSLAAGRTMDSRWISKLFISIVFIVINMFKVDLKLKAEAGDLGTYTNNGEWDLLSEPKIFSKYLWAKHRRTLKIWKSPRKFWKHHWTNYRHTWVRRVQKIFCKSSTWVRKSPKIFCKAPWSKCRRTWIKKVKNYFAIAGVPE